MRHRNRLPVVTQLTTTECGLCVALCLLGFHGRHESMLEARETLSAGRGGLSLSEIEAFLRDRGLEVKRFRPRNIEVLAKFTAPVILYWKDAHFVVLERFDGKDAWVMDPARGRRCISRDELADGFAGAALWASPTAEFEQRPRRRLDAWRSSRLVPRTDWLSIGALAVLSLASYGTLIAVPRLTEWMIDNQMSLDSAGRQARVVSVLVGLAAGFFLLALIRTVVLARIVAVLGRKMMHRVFDRLLSLPYQFFTTRQPGELLFRLNSVNGIRDVIATRLAKAVVDAGMFVALGVYMVTVDWRPAALGLGLVVVNSIAVALARQRMTELVDEEVAQASKSQTMQIDAIVSIPTIRLGGYESEIVRSWDGIYDSALTAMRQRMVLQDGKVGALSSALSTFGPVALLLYCLTLFQQGELSLGAAVALQVVAGTFFALSSSLIGTYTEFVQSGRYLDRINEILLTDAEPDGGTRTAAPDSSVSLQGVSFRYSPNDVDVLRDVTLDVAPGERVAIVGRSGSGKSTLARIIATLYTPTDGELHFGGVPFDDFERRSLRSVIGFVPQETHMHNKSVFENLTLGRDLSRDDVIEVCERVGIGDLVAQLPLGLDTVVTEMGANFSGGQRQRFALARTLLQRPDVLILDEATASLDNINERRIVEYLRESGATQIIVAHRLATVRHADRIIVLEDGEIAETGTHDELITGGGVYAELYHQPSPSGIPAAVAASDIELLAGVAS